MSLLTKILSDELEQLKFEKQQEEMPQRILILILS